ncbi:MAG TPA: alpha/beta hydrolase [Streptosporangiaceae bacterium]|jgi:acetyl esterase|nr:alpha/beta hydrolase [Streptosporangiaceae bacterium]
MPFHPQVQAIRDRLERDQVPNLYTLSIEDAREADVKGTVAGAGNKVAVADVSEREIPGPAGPLRIRVYQPDAPGPWPVLVYFFGGGWSLGTLDTSDDVCRRLTSAAGCLTVSVSYRLAPENKFPAAVEDAYAGAAWVAAHAAELGADPSRIAVAGDSSGGNLTIAVTLLARQRGGPRLVHQLLVYPNTDYQSDTDSMRECRDEHFFNPNAVQWYWGMYLATPDDGANPLASPLREADLSGLPPATLISAEFDPLRDEGERYAARLAEAGVPVEVRRYDGVPHAFFTMTGFVDAAGQAMEYAAARLRAAFTAA